jgi:Holliday junction resolvase
MSRNKGQRAEVAVVNWLRGHGFEDARRYLAGDGRQPGDIDAIPGVSIEVKDQQQHRIGEWLRQAEAEARSALPVVFVKEKGTADVGQWWAVLRVRDFVGLVADEQQEDVA